jgi:hypothetical protein
MTPLKQSWPRIYPPLVEHLKLQLRMNIKRKVVELRTSQLTTDPEAIQRGVDFLQAFVYGFDVDDAIALLRLDDLYIETFEVKDVKSLTGDHLARAIGRIAVCGDSFLGEYVYVLSNVLLRAKMARPSSPLRMPLGLESCLLTLRFVTSLIFVSWALFPCLPACL